MSWLHRIFEPKQIEVWTDRTQQHEHRLERKRLSENHYLRAQAIGAWLLATLVAVNGGAMALDFTSADDAPPFVVGIVLAILAGFASWRESQDRTGLHYVESLLPENVTDHGRVMEQRWRWRGPAMRFFANWLNWGSLIAFVVGCSLTAIREDRLTALADRASASASHR